MAHAPQRADSTKRPRGRPPVHREEWSKVSVVLMRRQVRRLDRLRIAIYKRTGRQLTRAEFIRALLDALEESALDVTAASSGAVLKDLVSRKLSG
jgi:hypothetical protein